jgi:AcrR family transcriptional regulator
MPDRLPHLPGTHPLRADAEDNRERVLESARSLFSERGLDIPMRAIARHAGVGPATLYRRFPTKQDLIDAAFTDELRACRAIVDEACADPDPWRGLCSFLYDIGELNAQNQGFVEAFLSTFPTGLDFTEHRTATMRSVADLCRRAQAVGAVRPDIVSDDIVLILMAGRGITASTVEKRVAAARRFAALAIEAFRNSGADSILPSAVRVAEDLLSNGRGVTSTL